MQPSFYYGLFMTLVLVLALLGIVWFIQRRQGRKETQPGLLKTTSKKRRGGLLHLARLIGFTLLTILVIGGGVMLFMSYQAIVEDTAPAPSQVDIPTGLPFRVEEVTFPGGDGLQMSGWYVPSQNGATVILLHGYGGNRTDMLWHAQVLVENGYGVLMYDERASGESGGDHRSYAWEDPADVGGALDYLNTLPTVETDKIGIGGCSIGGQIALQGAAYFPQIAATWADGPATVTSRDIPAPFNWATALAVPSNWMMDRMLAERIHRPIPLALIDLIGTLEPRPIMMIAGGQPHPNYGPESWHVQYLARFAGKHTQLWIIPEAYHCDGPVQRPEEYAAKMVGFFDDAFGIKR